MGHSGSNMIAWLRTGFVLLLLLLGYSVSSGIIYLLWSRLVGWPVVGEEHEALLRLVHLLPSLACGAMVGCIGGATNRTAKALLPAAFLGLGIALIHYASYSRSSRAAVDDIVAAIIESVVLFVVVFVSFWMLAVRRGRANSPPSPLR